MKNKNIYIFSLIIIVSSLLNFSNLKIKNSYNTFNRKNVSKKINNNSNLQPQGYPYITNISFDNIRNPETWSIVQDNDGVMLFADRKGIIAYNGSENKYFTFKRIPFVLSKNSKNGKIYAGCNNDFGLISKESFFDYKFNSLKDSLEINDNFKNIEFNADKTYFIGETTIFSVDSKSNSVSFEFETDSLENISGYIKKNNDILVLIGGKGLYSLTTSKFVNIKNIDKVINDEILFSTKYKNKVIFATNNKIYTLKENIIYDFKTEAESYIKESVIRNGLDVDKDKFIITTLNGGIVFIDKNTGKTISTINYRTGLPDDEIFSVGTDSNNGLWVSHEYGLSRIAQDFQFRNYSNYPGIEGKINDLIKTDSSIYIATGEGVYYLSKIKAYKEIEVVIKRTNKRKKVYSKQKDEVSEAKLPEIKEKKFNKEDFSNITDDIFKLAEAKKRQAEEEKKRKAEALRIAKERAKLQKKQESAEEKYRKIYELQSVKYAFKKIEGLNEKCKELIKFNNGLLITSNSGLYFYKNFKLKKILKDVYVNQVVTDIEQKHTYIATKNGLFTAYANKNNKIIVEPIVNKVFKKNTIHTLSVIPSGIIIAGGLNQVFFIEKNENTFDIKSHKFNTDFPDIIEVKQTNSKILFFLSESVYQYDSVKDSITFNKEYSKNHTPGSRTFFPNNNSFITIENNIITKSEGADQYLNRINFLNFFTKIENIFIDIDDNLWFVADNKLYKSLHTDKNPKEDFTLSITDVYYNNTIKIDKDNIKLNHDFSKLTFKLSAPYYLKQESIKYYYSTDKDNEEYAIELATPKVVIPTLKGGKHFITIFAKNALGEKSNVLTVRLQVKPPFTETTFFWIIIVSAVGLIIFVLTVIINRQRSKKLLRQKKELERQVQERTLEIRKQNTKITNQNKEITKQHNNIKKSISYASKIQKAVLPYTGILKNYFSGYFIFYLPRDVVSGDFYWVAEFKNRIYVAAADCTGHGVPGGFLSMMEISFLNDIVSKANIENKTLKANEILNILRDKTINGLQQSENYSANDGMDVSLVIIDKEKMVLEYAGANNPIYIISNGELITLNPDRMPIGKFRNASSFASKTFNINKDDTFYMFSDGYSDQFGGDDKRKFSKMRLKQLLLQIQDLPMSEQEKMVENIYKKWKGEGIQIDDILLMGLKI